MINLNLDFIYEELENPKHPCGVVETCGVDSLSQVDTGLQTPQEIEESCGVSCGVKEDELVLEDFFAEELPQTLIDWLANPKTQAGDQWPIPEDLLPKFDVLVNAADSLVRRRDSNLRIWRGQKSLQLKVFFGPDPPPLRKRSGTGNRFRTNNTKRIQTMWSPEEGWLHWDEDRQDYVAQPASNTPKDQGEEMNRAPD